MQDKTGNAERRIILSTVPEKVQRKLIMRKFTIFSDTELHGTSTSAKKMPAFMMFVTVTTRAVTGPHPEPDESTLEPYSFENTSNTILIFRPKNS
jgi:hypothetical protein